MVYTIKLLNRQKRSETNESKLFINNMPSFNMLIVSDVIYFLQNYFIIYTVLTWDWTLALIFTSNWTKNNSDTRHKMLSLFSKFEWHLLPNFEKFHLKKLFILQFYDQARAQKKDFFAIISNWKVYMKTKVVKTGINKVLNNKYLA